MRIAIISDTHDNIWKLGSAMPHLAASDFILHCGDICSPFVVKQLAENLGEKPIHVVWGNNDGDKRLLTRVAQKAGNIHMHGDFAEIKIEGNHIALTHYPQIGHALASTARYDLVCYGHDHTAYDEWVGETLLINPGEVMGLNGRSSLAIYSPNEKELSWIEIE
ncbi:MAG: metallophosphoesterase [Chloroflexi bacterium]|nr:metallophosphoesterase [Chloroflexota bacterium]